MAYTLEIADILSKTLVKFATLNSHQLAGHVANIDFWSHQVKHALDVIDGYSKRQHALERAQKEYISDHDTKTFRLENAAHAFEFPEDYLFTPTPDRHHIDAETLKFKRREVVDSFYNFLIRCHKDTLVTRAIAKKLLDNCGIGIEPGDFRDMEM